MQRAAAQDIARLIAETLRAQFPAAAYLAMTIEGEREAFTQLFPHSVRDAAGGILCDFEDHLLPPVAHSSPLNTAWGKLSPRDPFDLRTVLRLLFHGGGQFDDYPENLRIEGDEPEGVWMPCLLLSDAARPARWENPDCPTDLVLRPCSAARPK
ncbi:hypothetical protein AB0G73_24350 [Streptomyces sp. NPDC020719]|uniref:hypothetical protein n=1 Tax=Streptomyces sp. NPDC020719 TaxID=3154896 RepID=UPI00340BB381